MKNKSTVSKKCLHRENPAKMFCFASMPIVCMFYHPGDDSSENRATQALLFIAVEDFYQIGHHFSVYISVARINPSTPKL